MLDQYPLSGLASSISVYYCSATSRLAREQKPGLLESYIQYCLAV